MWTSVCLWLEHSHHIVWVVAASVNESKMTFPGQCIGFARATSDGGATHSSTFHLNLSRYYR
jgi:hypothetical protein